MDFEKILATVERILPDQQFSTIEKFIFRQSWLGQTYSEMAKDSGYGSEYIKEVGSRLWQDLSEALGERVTKKNFQLVLSQSSQVHWNPEASEQDSPHQDRPDQSSSPPNGSFPSAPDSDRVPVPPASVQVDTPISFPSGPLPVTSPLYIERPPIESLAYSEIAQSACVIRLKAPKQMGKSSLLNRVLDYAQNLDYLTVHLDFQEAEQAVFSSLDRFLRWFCANVSRQLQLVTKLEDYWDEEMGSKISCKMYFTYYLLEHVDRPIVIALNELNQVFEHPEIAQDFLPMLRSWHELAKQNQTWQKLRLVLVHATEVYVPLKLNQSPFNVGLSIKLPPFTLEQAQTLALRYGLSWAGDPSGAEQLAPLYAMTGGHPYLVNLAFYHLRHGETCMEDLLKFAPASTGIYGHHLRGHLATLQSNPILSQTMWQVVHSEEAVQLNALTAYKLESMGLIQLESNWAKPGCELYRLYFREQL
ncbi:AAA-like domain-containing protein [Egbenema bharatensis]|uniref:AAA-like domain-containing protein n=1 Tax=Egbenema bharatensis TaxID=3463334 RepID=UPI003A8921E3